MLSFGLVNIPVKVYTATKSKLPSFHYLHKECHTPLKYKRYCPKCKITVPWEDVVKGYEYEKGKYVILKDEDFERIALAQNKIINIIEFVKLSDIDPIYFDNAYYLEAEGVEKAYKVLLKGLKETGKVAVGKIVLKDKEHVVIIRPFNGLLVMHTLFYNDEIIKPKFPFMKKKIRITRQEIKMAKELINTLSGTLHLEKFKDRYREKLLQIIEAKLKGITPPIEINKEIKATKKLMSTLKESIMILKKKKKKHK